MQAKTVSFQRHRDPKEALGFRDDEYYMRKFCEENGYEFGINQNHTPYVSIDVYYFSDLLYALVKNIKYTIIDYPNGKSLSKIWYGVEPNPKDFGKDFYQKFRNINELSYEEKIAEFKKFKDLPTKRLNHNVIGTFSGIEGALKRIQINIKKELKK